MARNYFVIGISGTTNSGKTTAVRKLRATFPGSTTMCQDCYFLDPHDERLEMIPQRNHANWEKLSAIDMKSMVNNVHKWIQYQQTKRSNSPQFSLHCGFLIYNYSPLAELFDRKYFLTIDKETCKDRRSERVYVPADPPWYFEEVVWPMYNLNLEEIRAQNDICVLSGAEDQEKLVNIIKEDIHEFLKKSRCL
ncbi:LOW QUALITY PROTEIN: nicotinamide riboside kinase 1-like [Haliotis rubra]|uniref:LOW QUALITY PROTEIN: nicotinamide riboside kinase 1-like n=1 Tax=Haliotis rubra TaxID=36100 RepID=UPI001EE5F139|nr:LOW QUALITY PROTEIN: nicotinamide riboside kinase 1-like [Haliotis rubra]